MITEALIARLRSPYNLIAEWTRYVPLDLILSVHVGMLGLYKDNGDGTVTLTYERSSRIGRNFVVPFDLFERTWRYDRDKPTKLDPRDRPYQKPAIFIDDGWYVSEAAFLDAVTEASASSSEPYA